MADVEKSKRKAVSALSKAPNLAIRLLTSIGRHELGTLLVILLTVGAIWAFVAIADEVQEGDTHRIDSAIIELTRSAENPDEPWGTEMMREVGRDITALGGISVLVIISVAAAGFLFLQRKTGGMILLIVAVVGGLLLSFLLKEGFDRDRPPYATGVFTASFPSGHSAMSAVVFLTLGALLARFQRRIALRTYLMGLAVLLTVLVGCSRVYLGVHWPTDVLAGWTLGAAWAMTCWLIARWLQVKGAVEEPAEMGDVQPGENEDGDAQIERNIEERAERRAKLEAGTNDHLYARETSDS